MRFFYHQPKSRECLVLDIGTSSISGFFVRVQARRAPEVIFPLEVGLGFSGEPRFIERRIIKAAGELFPLLKRKLGAERPEQILVVFSPPLYSPLTPSIKMARREIFVITPSLLDELIGEELLSLKRKSHEMFSKSEGARVLENHMMRTLCNGYSVQDPIKKRTQELELAFYVSLVSRDLSEEMEDMLRHHFGALPIKMSSSALALFLILKDIFNAEEGFLLLDVGGEAMEVSLVRGGVLEKVRSFAAGENFMLRHLASSLNLVPEEVISLVRSAASGAVKAGLEQKVSGFLSKAGEKWCQRLKQLLENIAEEKPLPQTLLLLGGSWSIETVKHCCQSQEVSSFTILGQPFRILTIVPKDLDGRLSILGFDRQDSKMTRPALLALAGAGALSGNF